MLKFRATSPSPLRKSLANDDFIAKYCIHESYLRRQDPCFEQLAQNPPEAVQGQGLSAVAHTRFKMKTGKRRKRKRGDPRRSVGVFLPSKFDYPDSSKTESMRNWRQRRAISQYRNQI